MIPRSVGRNLILAGGCLLAGLLGSYLAPAGQEALLWPPAGVAVAGLFGWGLRCWPGVWAGAVFLHLWAGPFGLAPFLATGDTLGPVLAAASLRFLLPFDPSFRRLRDALGFLLAAAVAMTVSASVGTGCLYLAGEVPGQAFGEDWLRWWVRDALGVLVFAPPLLAWPGRDARPSPGTAGEAGLLALLTLALAVVVFDDRVVFAARQAPIAFLLLPLPLWAALRLRAWGASGVALLLALAAALGTAHGCGPFALPDALPRVGTLWLFLGAVGLLGPCVSPLLPGGTRGDRERAEETLRKSGAFRETIIRTAGEGICVCYPTPDYPFVAFSIWNERMTELTGYTMEEINRSGWYQTMYPDPELQQRAVERMERMRHGDDLRAEEWEITRKDGERRKVAISTSRVELEEGIEAVALMRDVTEDRQAEEALRRRYAELEVLHRIGVICSEAESEDELLHRVTGVLAGDLYPDNCGFLLLDTERGMVVTHPSFVLRDPAVSREDKPLGLGIVGEVARTGKGRRAGDVRAEPAYLAADPRTLSELCVPMKVGGRVVGVLNVEKGQLNAFSAAEEHLLETVVDLVGNALERLRAEQALRESEELFRLITENSGDLVSLTDLEMRCVYTSPAVRHILGHDPADRVGRNGWEDVHPEDLAPALEAWSNTKPGEMLTTTFRVRHANGSWRWLEARARTIPYQGETLILAVARDITERKQAEGALLRSEKQYRDLVETAQDLIWSVDVEGKWTFVNRSGARAIYGCEPEEMLGRPFPEFTTPEQARKDLAVFAVIKAGEPVFRYQSRHLRKDGTPVHFTINALPLYDADGKPLGATGTSSDITELKRAQEALTLFRSLIDHINDGIEVVDAEAGRFLDVNEWSCKAHGYTREEYLALTVPDVDITVGAHPWEEIREDIRRAGARTFLSQHRRKDGSLFPVEVNVTHIRLDREYLLAVVRDITERKQVEEELRASRWVLQTVLDNIPQGVFWKDRESRYLGCNRVVARAFGIDPPEAMVGKTDHDIPGLRWEEANFFIRKDREAMEQQTPILDIVEPATLPDGSSIWMETSKIPMRDPDGKVVGVLGTWQDITEKKRAREAQERSTRLLAALSRTQDRFISEPALGPTFEEMLATLLAVTDSEYGFIGEILTTPEGQPYLKTHAITNIAWNEELRAFYEREAPAGLEFFNLDTLFGAVLRTGEPVFANAPGEDPRRGGLPGGHPPLRAFLGLPFHQGSELIGMVGVANRPGGYDPELGEFLEPFLLTCANMIVGLRNDRARRKAEEATRRALGEKEALLKEIHHRVKNNLQVINSLLSLQARQVAEPSALGALLESQSRIRAMALVHETLYGADSFARIDLPQYIESLCHPLLRTFGGGERIRLERQVAEVALDMERAVPCGLIVNELVSNALKYAFPGNREGRVVVSLDDDPGVGYILAVSDDGVGLPEGIDLSGSRSLGLHLVNLLTRQLRGRLEVSQRGGTRFTISFPA